jgi:hypothetical protein
MGDQPAHVRRLKRGGLTNRYFLRAERGRLRTSSAVPSNPLSRGTAAKAFAIASAGTPASSVSWMQLKP